MKKEDSVLYKKTEGMVNGIMGEAGRIVIRRKDDSL